MDNSYSQGCDINDSGCLGGSFEALTYADIGSGTTGYVEVENGPSKVSPDMLLNVFWEIRDPTTLNRQGSDVGTEYRSAIIFYTPEQESSARTSKERLERFGRYKNPIVTAITFASQFFNAEEYHRQYFEKRGFSHYTINLNM